jgi:hypothetical protein
MAPSRATWSSSAGARRQWWVAPVPRAWGAGKNRRARAARRRQHKAAPEGKAAARGWARGASSRAPRRVPHPSAPTPAQECLQMQPLGDAPSHAVPPAATRIPSPLLQRQVPRRVACARPPSRLPARNPSACQTPRPPPSLRPAQANCLPKRGPAARLHARRGAAATLATSGGRALRRASAGEPSEHATPCALALPGAAAGVRGSAPGLRRLLVGRGGGRASRGGGGAARATGPNSDRSRPAPRVPYLPPPHRAPGDAGAPSTPPFPMQVVRPDRGPLPCRCAAADLDQPEHGPGRGVPGDTAGGGRARFMPAMPGQGWPR